MRAQSRLFKSTAALCAAATAALMIAGTQPASAGASTGSWRYYPQGVYGGYGGGYGHNPYYGSRPAYGRGYGYGYGGGPGYGYGYERPYYRERRYDPGAAVAAGVVGLAAGAILSGALSQRGRHTVSCTQYRTYNPQTGTYVGRGGKRYACR